jgi:hypothetical protein
MLRSRLTYSNVMATIAVFVALGGSGYAATKINGKNIKNKSIAGKKLKNRTITRGKVKKNTLGGSEIAESRLGQVGDAKLADDATHAGQADNATRAGTADDAGAIDGIDSSAFARRSDGTGFLVASPGWTTSSGALTRTAFTGQTFFQSSGTTDAVLSLPLSYPTRSNGRPLGITSVRLCRSTTNATITSYGISTGSGDSPANGGDAIPASSTGSGCDVIDISDVNGGAPFPANGNLTADLTVGAHFNAASASVTVGGAQLTLVPR